MLSPRAAAGGPFIEEKTSSQELFQNRSPQAGHEVFLVRDAPTCEVLLIHQLAIDAEASAASHEGVVAAARQALDFRHPAVLPVQRVEGAVGSLTLAQSFPGGILLCDFLSRNGPFSPCDAVQLMRSFADALRCAESMGLTLSQISPQDFIVDHAPAGQAVPVVICLCPPVPRGWWLEVADAAFASPEQKHQRPCNALSALYSAGALLAHMLTGRLPDRGETWTAWLEHEPFAPPLKAALVAVLQEDPARRSQGPAAWMHLLALAQTEPPHTLSELVSKARAQTPRVLDCPPGWCPPRPPTRKKSPWRDALALGAVVCVGFVLMWQVRRSAERTFFASRSGKEPAEVRAVSPASVATGEDGLPLEPTLPGTKDAVSIRPAQAVTLEDELLHAARLAPLGRQAELYRQVLKKAPDNREALHGVVEDALADFPKDEARLRDLRRWISALEKAGDPLGAYSHGRLLLEGALKAPNLRSASESLTTAVRSLEQAAERGYHRAWFPLLQGLVNLHNVQQQAGNARQAARTERVLFEKIDAMPPSVPAQDTRLLAERLRRLMAEGTAQGRQHPQANLLRRVVQRLQNVESQREATVSQAR